VGLTASSAIAAEPSKEPQCHAVGGTVMTDFISDTTTLGTATGDLRGGVSATLVDQAPEGDAVVFFVQHHWVTDAGDVILSDVARATAKPVGPGLFAIVSYPVKITGGTGRFAGATGRLDNIGELDATTGRTIFRYHGDVCLAGPSK
jgi:hypothetical protein